MIFLIAIMNAVRMMLIHQSLVKIVKMIKIQIFDKVIQNKNTPLLFYFYDKLCFEDFKIYLKVRDVY